MPAIFSDLSASASDLTTAKRLKENAGVAFQGAVLVGDFDIPGIVARDWLAASLNPNGRPNTDVVKPYVNASDIVRTTRDQWVVDFKTLSEPEAAYFEAPFQHLVDHVHAFRQKNNRERRRRLWWRHGDVTPQMWDAISQIRRTIFSPRVSKHRLFVWFNASTVPDSAVVAIARDDDTSFGILHSRFHEHWSLRLGTWLGVGNDPRYTPTTTFETFPFPQGLTPDLPAASYAGDPRAQRIAAAAQALDERRRAWLNPPDLVDIVPEIVPTAAPGEAPVKYPDRILPKNAQAAVKLKERTLTNLYNQRPQWLASLHDDLDRAVAAAYGWPEDISTEDALARLLALNLERAAAGR